MDVLARRRRGRRGEHDHDSRDEPHGGSWPLGAAGGPTNQPTSAAAQPAGVPCDSCVVDIFAATARGDLAAVRALLDVGVPVGERDERGWTPLHVAVATGQADIVDLLLERGADVHARHGQGSPPLFTACNKPYEAI